MYPATHPALPAAGSTRATAPVPVPARRDAVARRALARRATELALALVFVGAGAAKLAAAPAMLALFGTLGNVTGVGSWFRPAVGLAEVLGAVLLCVPALAGVGAVALATIMAGAIVVHLGLLHTTPVAPAVLLAALAAVAYANRAGLAAAAAGLERNL